MTETRYFDNEIDDHADGASFDIRFKIARKILENQDFGFVIGDPEKSKDWGMEVADAALAAATHLVQMAEEFGLVTHAPEHDISTRLKRTADRQAKYEVFKQMALIRESKEAQGRIDVPNQLPALNG